MKIMHSLLSNSHLKRMLVFVMLSSLLFSGEKYITYGFSGGRFGDNLAAYIHAKWIEYQCGCKVIYRPFPYSDQLALSVKEEEVLDDAWSALIENAVEIPKEGEITRERLQKTVYHLPYFPPDLVKSNKSDLTNQFHENIQVDWNNSDFIREVQRNVRPLRKLKLVPLENDVINVAIHFRRGSRYDDPHADKLDPLKFPPLEYVANQLEQCVRIYRRNILRVFLFTDYEYPEEVEEYLKSRLRRSKIKYAYHHNPRSYAKRTLTDFFSMMRFTCIIRSSSSYSSLAAKLSDCSLEISPTKYTLLGEQPRITGVQFRYNAQLLGRKIKRVVRVPYEQHIFVTK
jgi:hypothetical protein